MTAEFIFLNDTIRINVPHSVVRVRVRRLFSLVSHRVYVLNLLCGISPFQMAHTMGPIYTIRLQSRFTVRKSWESDNQPWLCRESVAHTNWCCVHVSSFLLIFLFGFGRFFLSLLLPASCCLIHFCSLLHRQHVNGVEFQSKSVIFSGEIYMFVVSP